MMMITFNGRGLRLSPWQRRYRRNTPLPLRYQSSKNNWYRNCTVHTQWAMASPLLSPTPLLHTVSLSSSVHSHCPLALLCNNFAPAGRCICTHSPTVHCTVYHHAHGHVSQCCLPLPCWSPPLPLHPHSGISPGVTSCSSLVNTKLLLSLTYSQE
jgi:hypothetical protein